MMKLISTGVAFVLLATATPFSFKNLLKLYSVIAVTDKTVDK